MDSGHFNNFKKVLSLQMPKEEQEDKCFDPSSRGPLLNYMNIHQDELKLYIVSQVMNTQKVQNLNHLDQIKKRER